MKARCEYSWQEQMKQGTSGGESVEWWCVSRTCLRCSHNVLKNRLGSHLEQQNDLARSLRSIVQELHFV